MKISELNFEQTIEILGNITPYITSIMKDKELIESLKKKTKSDKDDYNRGIDILNKSIPVILNSHKEDIIHILAILNFESYETTKNKNIFEVVRDIQNLLDDKELIAFLKSLV